MELSLSCMRQVLMIVIKSWSYQRRRKLSTHCISVDPFSCRICFKVTRNSFGCLREDLRRFNICIMISGFHGECCSSDTLLIYYTMADNKSNEMFQRNVLTPSSGCLSSFQVDAAASSEAPKQIYYATFSNILFLPHC